MASSNVGRVANLVAQLRPIANRPVGAFTNRQGSFRAVACLAAGVSSLFGADAPAIRRQGVVNAASQRPAAAGGAIATGSLISIHGVGFAPDPKANVVRLKTPKGTLVLPVLHANPQRLEAWIPPSASPGPAELSVRSSGQDSAPEPVNLLHSGLGLFSANDKGWGVARTDSTSVPPGGTLTAFATGLQKATFLEMRIAGRLSKVLSVNAQRPDHIVEINIQVPSEAPEGCFVPLYGRVAGSPVSNSVTIAVKRDGGPCFRPEDDLFTGWSGGKTAIFVLSRTVSKDSNAAGDRMEDQLAAGFYDIQTANVLASPFLMQPPQGSCSAYATVLDSATPNGTSVSGLLLGSLGGDGLNATEVAVHWTGEVMTGTMAIIATSTDTESNTAGLTYCPASYASGQFTIPSGLLSQLPAGRGQLLLAFWPAQAPSVTVPGVDRLVLVSVFVQSAEVGIQ